jgi:hypothetical protein
MTSDVLRRVAEHNDSSSYILYNEILVVVIFLYHGVKQFKINLTLDEMSINLVIINHSTL